MSVRKDAGGPHRRRPTRALRDREVRRLVAAHVDVAIDPAALARAIRGPRRAHRRAPDRNGRCAELPFGIDRRARAIARRRDGAVRGVPPRRLAARRRARGAESERGRPRRRCERFDMRATFAGTRASLGRAGRPSSGGCAGAVSHVSCTSSSADGPLLAKRRARHRTRALSARRLSIDAGPIGDAGAGGSFIGSASHDATRREALGRCSCALACRA